MTIRSFNEDWSVGPKVSIYAALQGAPQPGQPVTLPYDAQFAMERSSKGEGAHNGYFPSANVEYQKTFYAPEVWRNKRLTLEFQGAYRDAVVFINDVFVAQRPNGYATFLVSLDDFLRYDEENTIRVELRAHEDSRWYSGVGLHRGVRLYEKELAHIAIDGVTITTPDVDAQRAVTEIATVVRNQSLNTGLFTLRTVILDKENRPLASEVTPVSIRAGQEAVVRQRVYVPQPELWSVDTPYLYRAVSELQSESVKLDELDTSFGIRTLKLDPSHGLRINDVEVKLRGACIHHDNGLLGAAAIPAAEERRVRILKESGFNAIRSAHNPISQAMLEACDRIGMLVIDETFDIWTVSKSNFDYSLAFPEWWERDVESIVAKDKNHPSVIMYSIGNENPETGNGLAHEWGRKLAEKFRSLDETRFVTNGVNGFVSVIKEAGKLMQENMAAMASAEEGGVNGAMNVGDFMNSITASPLVTERTAEAMSVLDVVGLNYGDARYSVEPELYPNRILLGTETFPSHIAVNWELVKKHSHVLGDFTWTGWDYLGEAGAGRITYLTGDSIPSFTAEYPWRNAWTGDIDITGYRRPISYFREIVFGLRSQPYISVIRPEKFGLPSFAGQWSWSDSVSGWSWDGSEGGSTAVEVYSDAEEVELFVNGVSQGRLPAGHSVGYLTKFEVTYEPGALLAVAFKNGVESGRSQLSTAGPELGLSVSPERRQINNDPSELVYIAIQITDENGVLAHTKEKLVTVEVSGPGQLLALGSGRPDTNERHDTGNATTFDGRALAIVRPTGQGAISIKVSAEGLEPVQAEVQSL